MKPERLDPKVRWGVMAVAMLAWAILMSTVGSQLLQIFQPLGMGASAFFFFAAFMGLGLFMIFLVLSPRRRCSECGGMLPKLRKPVSLNQALWGGWECPHCHADLSREGKRARAMGRKRRA